MAVATFDTLKFANTLKSAGVPDNQAEAIATHYGDAFQQHFFDTPHSSASQKVEYGDIQVDSSPIVGKPDDVHESFKALTREFAICRWLLAVTLILVYLQILMLSCWDTP